MFQTEKKICDAEGCGLKPLRGKSYCSKHLATHGKQKMTKEMQLMLRSACCNVACTVGERHEYGEQYCSRCKQGCIWKMPASSAASSR